MGFTWSTLNKGTDVTKDQITEVKDNIDTLRSDIGLTPWSWVNVPVTVGKQIENPAIEEIRDALDLTHDQNVCSSNHLTYNNPAYATQLTNEHTSLHGAQGCWQFCSIYWTPNYTKVYVNEFLANYPADGCPIEYGVQYEAYQSNYLRWKYYSDYYPD